MFALAVLCRMFTVCGCGTAAAAEPAPVGSEVDIAQASQTYKAVVVN